MTDWNGIRVFLAVARAGSLVGAARALAVSEATVGRHLRELEAGLGQRLFDRLPNRLALTAAGARLLGTAEAMDDTAAAFARAAAGGAEEVPPLRLTATTSVSLFLARHLDRLTAAAGGAQLRLIGTREPLDPGRREVDIALRMRRPPDRGPLTVRRVGAVAVALYQRAELGETVSAVIGLRADPESRQARWVEAAAGDAAMPVRIGDVHLRLEAARRGVGAALLPRFLGDSTPELRRIGPSAEALTEEVFLLVHEELGTTPTVRAVARTLTALFREQAAALDPP